MIDFEQFANFLKKYSTIPDAFINDFFSFYKQNTNEDDIIIDLHLVAKWLRIRKDTLKITLVRSYTKNVDYTISKKSLTTAGRPSETILISISCFKRISMNSNTEKGGEVRNYYEQIEKLLNKYKDHIIESLQKQVGILENNQKPKHTPKKGVIYFIRSHLEPENVFKIGKSKKFKSRYLSHNSSHSDDLEVILIFESDYINDVEDCMKVALRSKQYRKRKEIYNTDVDTLKSVLKKCDKLITMVHHPKVKNKKPTQKRAKGEPEVEVEYNYYMYVDKIDDNSIIDI
jgi:phage anti-repressor protein